MYGNSINGQFNQLPVLEGLWSPILSGSNTNDMGAFLAALTAAAILKTTKTRWWEQGDFNGTSLDLLAPACWPWAHASDWADSKWWSGWIHPWRPLDILGEGESSNVCIFFKSKQWALRAVKLWGVNIYLLPIRSHSLVKIIFSKPCFHYIMHSLAKNFIMLPIVQWNRPLTAALFVTSFPNQISYM